MRHSSSTTSIWDILAGVQAWLEGREGARETQVGKKTKTRYALRAAHFSRVARE
jgi:hypothetical protein